MDRQQFLQEFGSPLDTPMQLSDLEFRLIQGLGIAVYIAASLFWAHADDPMLSIKIELLRC